MPSASLSKDTETEETKPSVIADVYQRDSLMIPNRMPR